MDNQFENDYYGFEPQKPITENRNPAAGGAVNESQNFSSRKSRRDAGPARRRELERFNPIQHTAVYSENRFCKPRNLRPPCSLCSASAVQTPAAAIRAFSNASQPPFIPEQPPNPPRAGEPQKNKVNTALVVTVIVMGVLLLAALFGLFGFSVYTARNSNNNSNSGNSNGFSQQFRLTVPDGNGGYPQIPRTPPSPRSTEETDFSDKIDKNYDGLRLPISPRTRRPTATTMPDTPLTRYRIPWFRCCAISDKIGDNDKADVAGQRHYYFLRRLCRHQRARGRQQQNRLCH